VGWRAGGGRVARGVMDRTAVAGVVRGRERSARGRG
jgi:hypothetical protein